MSICLLLISDGRDNAMERCSASIDLMVPPVSHVVHVDDADHRLGFAGAIQEGWGRVLATGADYCLHVEADFVFDEEVPLAAMRALLERHPDLAQVALKRQAVNAEEVEAGGIVELHPAAFTDRKDDEGIWTEHRNWFTTNPSLYRADLCRLGWPQVPQSEGYFTAQLLQDPALRFAIWGGKFDPPRVTHIGERQGRGY